MVNCIISATPTSNEKRVNGGFAFDYSITINKTANTAYGVFIEKNEGNGQVFPTHLYTSLAEKDGCIGEQKATLPSDKTTSHVRYVAFQKHISTI